MQEKGISSFLLFIAVVLLALILVVLVSGKKASGKFERWQEVLSKISHVITKRGLPTPSAGTTPFPSGKTPPSQTLPPGTSRSDQYGVTLGLAGNEAYVGKALEKVGGIGVGWVRMQCDWRNVERQDNQWDFSSCDTAISKIESVGMKPLALLWLDSLWCKTSPGTDPQVKKEKPACTDEQFQDYVTHVVQRYKGRVSYYEVGNEPDLRPEWRDYPSSYAKVLHLAYDSVKKTDPNAKVVIGGFAACAGQNCNRKYLDTIINDPTYPALQNFDIFNYHTYQKKQDMAKLYGLIKQRVGNKPIWVTEVGFPSDARYQEARRPGYGYPPGEAGQAAYLKDVLPYLLSLGVQKVFWFDLVDVPKDKGEFCTYGLTYMPGKQCVGTPATGSDVTEKESFTAYKELLH